jgi:hypothetical protein
VNPFRGNLAGISPALPFGIRKKLVISMYDWLVPCGSRETADQGIRFEWLSEQADRATGCRSGFQALLCTRGDHDHWLCGATRRERSLQVKPAHTGHVNVGDDAVVRSFPVPIDKFFCRCERLGVVS